MPKLHEVVAIRKGVKTRTYSETTELYKRAQKGELTAQIKAIPPSLRNQLSLSSQMPTKKQPSKSGFNSRSAHHLYGPMV